MDASTVKKVALDAGADIVGIAGKDRFARVDQDRNPFAIFPHAQSLIVIGLRVIRGTLRGFEEGTYRQAYGTDNYKMMNTVIVPRVLRDIQIELEKSGYDALQLRNPYFGNKGTPAAPGKPTPDIMPNMRLCGVAAGLGEIGLSQLFLSPEFGPRQRLFAIITDADLEPDPLFEGTLCDECGDCVKGCPGNALTGDDGTIEIGGKLFRWPTVLGKKCFTWQKEERKRLYSWARNEKMPESVDELKDIIKQMSRLEMNLASCGARCMRNCVAHLEKKGAIDNNYKTPFRV